MNRYRFSKRSAMNLSSCHPDLQAIMTLALKWSPIDFGVSGGARTFEEQFELFKKGKSKIDPRKPGNAIRAKHMIKKGLRVLSEAADIFVWVPGKKHLAYSKEHLCMIAGVVEAATYCLFDHGKISNLVRWGGNWDRDGEILLDQKFIDSPHFELYSP